MPRSHWINLLKQLTVGTLLIPVSLASSASGIEGDWEATLEVSESVELPVVIHLHRDMGKWQGAFDTPSQGGFDIPMTAVEVKENSLSFDIAALQIQYRGAFDRDNNTIRGTFTQGKSLALNFVRQEEPDAQYADTSEGSVILGSWSGNLHTSAGKLVFVLEVARDEDGTLSARAQSPSQSEHYFAVDNFEFDRGSIRFAIDALDIRFDGGLSRDGKIIRGDFKQGPAVMKLSLDHKPAENKLSARPQTPVPPFDYHVEEVEVVNPGANVTLSGTLTSPRGSIRATAVMITGSGPQDRDESILRHRPFAVIADHLTKQGFAVLRLDDRGFGKSTGNFEAATSEDFASDADAAINYLKSRDDIPPDSIGLIGHSEGGMIASMVASQRADLAFVIMLAGPGVDIVDLYIEQRSNLFRSMGVLSSSLDQIKQLDSVVFGEINQLPAGGAVSEETLQVMRTISRAAGMRNRTAIDKRVDALAGIYTSPWFRYFLKFDPEPYIKGIKAPVLALNGSLDMQVSANQNLSGIRSALAEAGHSDYRVVELEKLNHLFQTADTGAISEYEEIEETIAPEALGLMSSWLEERFKP